MNRLSLAVLLALGASVAVQPGLAGPAFAQAAAPAMKEAPAAPATAADAPAATAAAPRHRMSMQQRFEAANTTHDGHLTKEQAEAASMKTVVKHFDQIDTEKRGYVTLDELRAHAKARRAAHKAAKPAKTEG